MHNADTNLLSLDKEIESKFEEMMKRPDSLKWFPWIGKEYSKSECRVLIVGESHYLIDDKEHPEMTEKNKEEAKRPDFTRNVIQTTCIDDKKKTQPTFDNLARCLFGDEIMEREKRMEVWKHLAFYNFVQCPMKTNKKRPKPKDMEIGWEVFAELIKILKPTHCIFIGFAAADNYNPYKCKRSKEKVGKYAARLFSAKIDEQNTCQCIAIKHTSQYFSWKSWSDFLQKRYPEMMQYLKYLLPKTREN